MNINLNDNVKVRIHDKGIEHIVKQNNDLLPARLHISFKEKKAELDEDGYLTMQMHSLMDLFGGLGISLPDYIGLSIEYIKT